MDKVGDLLNRLTTANPLTKEVKVKNSVYIREILKVLYTEGWIAGVYNLESKDSVQKVSTHIPSVYGCENEKVSVKAKLDSDINVVKELKVSLKKPYIDNSFSPASGISNSSSYLKIKGIRLSKPSRRLYYSVKELQKYLNAQTGYYTLVLTTPKGVMTAQNAIRLNLGGEVLFKLSL